MAGPPSEWELLDVLDRGDRLSHPERALLMAGRAAAGDDPAQMSPGERDAAVLDVRRRLLGPILEAVDTCGECAATVSIEVDLALMAPTRAPSTPMTVRSGGHHLRCRPPTGRDLVDAALSPDVGSARRVLLAATILSAHSDGEPVPVASLPDDVLATVGEHLLAADPLAEITLAVTCGSCGSTWLTQLDPVDFVWQELRTWSRRLLAEVHVLASAYGWTEREILELPPWRRRAYRELVAHG